MERARTRIGFTADGLSVNFDASSSSGGNTPITGYTWNFGDGATASGVAPQHTYDEAGTYPVTLEVTNGAGRTAELTQTVTVAESTEPVTETVIGDADSWRWRYEQDAPPSRWNARTFDSSGWSLGGAVLGWGHASVVTNISTAFPNTADRPRAAYFTKSFEVADASKVTQLVLDTVADDGAVVYVNGTEVARQNMPAGAITHMTFAPSARRAAVAEAQGFVIDVPVGLLVNGTNVVAVESHVNYRATPDLTFHLNADLTRTP
ncbi:MAG: PKD domain-containing protein [Nocardioidaceae bacterium]|nr:MAG: PKD domain-containing protein [Nocardioidaceae bacterium]